MVDNCRVPSLFPTSENGPSEHKTRSFIALLGGSSTLGGSTKGRGEHTTIGLQQHTNTNSKQMPTPRSQIQPPPTSEYPILPKEELNTPPLSKIPRGRPLGSKNKPKSPIIDNKEYGNILKHIVIEIHPGNDVIASIIKFARYHKVNLTVLNASGTVSDILIRHPLTRYESAFPFRGLHKMVSLNGTFMNFHFPYSSSISNDPPRQKNFVIYLSGSQGAVYGGIVAGKVMAASPVVVKATMFKNFEYHKVPYIDGNMMIEEGEEDSSSDNNQYSSGSNCMVVSKNNA